VLDDLGRMHSTSVGRENRWTTTPQRLTIARRCLDTVAARRDDIPQLLARHLGQSPD